MAFSAKNLLFSGIKESEKGSEFEDKVKKSFIKVKEHINSIENEFNSLKKDSILKISEISSLKQEISLIKKDLGEIKSILAEFKKSSSGNEGVYADIHSLNIHSLCKQKVAVLPVREPKLTISSSFKDFKRIVNTLAKQELLAFLHLYELEELKEGVSYIDLAKRMNISEGCVRTYISSLIKKGMPIFKKKYNNKIVLLGILPEFKQLNLREMLNNAYYELDPLQKRLF